MSQAVIELIDNRTDSDVKDLEIVIVWDKCTQFGKENNIESYIKQ